jgi:hypothetical protein
MLANASSERQCQIIEFDEVAWRGSKFEQSLSKGEFVRRNIAPEQYQCAPVILNRRLNFEKLHGKHSKGESTLQGVRPGGRGSSSILAGSASKAFIPRL